MKTKTLFLVLSLGVLLFAGMPQDLQAALLRHTIDDYSYPTSYYDQSGNDWYCGTFTYPGHRGSDYGIGGFGPMDQGIDIVAAAAGSVIYTHDGEFDRCTTGDCAGGGGFGNYVKVEHADGKITYYAHMRKWSVAVSTGQHVDCGDKLGQVGSSGYSTGPHIHFQVRTPVYGDDDPFAGDCSGPLSYWVDQGGYMGLPSRQCEGGSPTSVIVDDSDAGFTKSCGTGDWWWDGSGGYENHFFWTYTNGDALDCEGTWRPNLPSSGTYKVYSYIPLSYDASSTRARFEIHHSGGVQEVRVDQSVWGGFFQYMGTFSFPAGSTGYVQLRDDTGEAFMSAQIAFDAIKFEFQGGVTDHDGDGYTIAEGDCDDSDASIHPGATEVCDGVDNNCAGGVDEEPAASASCSNGLWCDGEEYCQSGSCRDGGDPCVDGSGCTDDICYESSDDCDNPCAATGPSDPCCATEPECLYDPVCTAAFTLDLEASYTSGQLDLDYTIGTPETSTWANFLVLTSPSVQVVPLWTVPLPAIAPPIAVPVSFSLPALGQIGIFTGLITAGGLQASELVWVDTGS